jgi:hypothetical protein
MYASAGASATCVCSSTRLKTYMDVSSFLVNLHSCKSIIKTFTKDTECTVYGGHGVKERTPRFLRGFFLDGDYFLLFRSNHVLDIVTSFMALL